MTTYKSKALGLALVAVLAMSAVVASAAQAATHTFYVAGGGKALLTSEAPEGQEFGVNGGSMECGALTVSNATLTSGSTSFSVSPKYNDEKYTCMIRPIGSLTVHTNNCSYLFSGAEDENQQSSMQISCPGSKKFMEFSGALGCTVTIGEQTVNGVEYSNVTGPPGDTIMVEPHVTGISYTANYLCNLAGITSGSNGTWTGNILLKGFESVPGGGAGRQLDIAVDTPPPPPPPLPSFKVTGASTANIEAQAKAPQIFSLNGGEWSCSTLALSGAIMTNGATSFTGAPRYNNEEASCGFSPWGVNRIVMNGCTYRYTTEGVGSTNRSPVVLACASGKQMEIWAPLGCTVTIPPQSMNGVSYSNVAGSPGTIMLEPHITGIHYTANSLCNVMGITSGENGGMSGNVLLKASGKGVGISVS